MRLIRQTEMAECALACLTMIANFHGADMDLAGLRRRFQPSLRGAALKSLIGMADRMGLTAHAVKAPLGQLRNLHLPAILHWDMRHYVVLEEIRGGAALIHDPGGRSVRMPLDEVSEHFTGVALELRPADDFEPVVDRSRLKLSQLWRRVTGLRRALVQVVVFSLVMQAFVLASPYYMQVAIDTVVPASDRDLLLVLAVGFAIFTGINAAASLLRTFVLLSAGTSLGYGISANIARRLFRLPISWFEKRHVGDVLSRFQSVSPIRQFMTEGAIGALLDGSLTVLTIGVMFAYSPALSAIAVAAIALYGAVRLASFRAQKSAQEESILASSREQTTMIESLRGIVTLRLYNREAARHALWQTRFADATNANVRLARISGWQQTGGTFILGLETVVSVWLAVRFVIGGGFSVGMVFAYLAYKTMFLQRAASLMDQVVGFRMLGLHLERLADIALTDQDRSFTSGSGAGAELVGHIEMRDVRFRYGPSEPWILEGVDLVVEPGSHVAITGPSGGGKSTMVKVLLGLLEPDAGEVLIDGMPLDRFGLKNFHEQVGAVLQDDSLFAGSIAENIALFEDAPDMARVVEASAAAALHKEILVMPMRYETLVGDMGSSLSGGQRQRLLLARALYRKPKLLLVDEGTSNLDAARERIVNASISKLGITRVVIAHRMETIVAADRILAARRGRLVDVTSEYDAARRHLLPD